MSGSIDKGSLAIARVGQASSLCAMLPTSPLCGLMQTLSLRPGRSGQLTGIIHNTQLMGSTPPYPIACFEAQRNGSPVLFLFMNCAVIEAFIEAR
jgi:hypothetical protein